MTDKTGVTLLPCPFCGAAAPSLCDTPFQEMTVFAVSCRTVRCHGAIFSLGYGQFPTKAEAVDAWNSRAAMHSAPDLARQRIADAKRIAELEEALGRISGLNDLSEATDDEIEAVARSKLHECELVACAALKDSQ